MYLYLFNFLQTKESKPDISRQLQMIDLMTHLYPIIV